MTISKILMKSTLLHGLQPFFVVPPWFFTLYLKAKKTQWLSRERLRSIQDLKLRFIVKHAYEKVRYYHNLFRRIKLHPSKIRGVEDLPKLPTLTKEDIRRNYCDMLASDIRNYKSFANMTSGSTGEPLKVYVTNKTWRVWYSYVWRQWRWVGYKWREPLVEFRPPYPAMGEMKFRTDVPRQYYYRITNSFYLSTYSMSESTLQAHAEQIIKFKPTLVRGTPSSLYLMARFLLQEGIELPRPKAVITASETLYAKQQEVIAEAFGCEVFPEYGGGEYVASAYQCPRHKYHISEIGIIEVLRGEEVADIEETGEIVVTTLMNKAMPLIRYRIGDLGALSDQSCVCGRTLPILTNLQGKIRDIVVTPEGKYIHGEFFTWLIEQEWVKQAQIVQSTKTKIVISIVLKREPTKQEENFVVSTIEKLTGPSMSVNLKFVDEIPTTRTGKRRFVICQVSTKLWDRPYEYV